MITATANEWSIEIGIDDQTLKRRITAVEGSQPKPREQISAKRIWNATQPDNEDPKQRLLLAQAIEQERINAVEAAELVKMSEVEELLSKHVVAPLRQRLL